MEPTKEQIKWLWEQCGGIYINYNDEDGCPAHYKMPDGGWLFDTVKPDLNNLFRHAVPKVIDGSNILLQNCLKGWFVSVEKTFGNYIDAKDKDPAMALFWAIYRCLGGK